MRLRFALVFLGLVIWSQCACYAQYAPPATYPEVGWPPPAPPATNQPCPPACPTSCPETPDNLAMFRVDSPNNFDSTISLFLYSQFVSARVLNLSGANWDPTDWQIGSTPIIYRSEQTKLRLGAFYGQWTFNNDDWNNGNPLFVPRNTGFIIPYISFTQIFGCNKGRFYGDLSYYIPTDHGPHVLMTNDLYAEGNIGAFRLGLAGQYSQINESSSFIVGPRVGFDFNESMGVNLDYFVWRSDSDRIDGFALPETGPQIWRLEFAYRWGN